MRLKAKCLPLNRKGQTVYYAYPKSQQKQTNVVCDTLQLGMNVDLAELRSFRLVLPSKMMDTPRKSP